MRTFSLLCIAILIGSAVNSQSTKWQEAIKWKLYNIPPQEGLEIPLAQLGRFESINLNDDSMHVFMNQVVLKKDAPAWEGVYIASCELSGNPHKIVISVFGGFLYDEQLKLYYEVPPAIKSKWMEFLSNGMKRLTSK